MEKERMNKKCKLPAIRERKNQSMAPGQDLIARELQHRCALSWPLSIRYSRNPCVRDPPTGNFKNFKFFENPPKILNVYFLGIAFSFGDNVYFWGDNVYFWILGDFRVFGISFCCWGVLGLCGSGGPVGFSKISNSLSSWRKDCSSQLSTERTCSATFKSRELLG